ncbi:MAG: arylesterase, partial [Cypionkella sp.]|nr:arylesterase [Cypionkella sp.]
MTLSLSFRTLAYGAMRLGRNLAFTALLPVSAAFAEEPVQILALGDSLTAGYGLPEGEGLVPQVNGWMQDKGHAVTLVNAGVSGDTSAGGLSRLAWSLQEGIGAMMVILGGNDLLRGLPPEVTRANIAAILTEAQARGLPVLLVGMEAPGNFGPEYKEKFDGLYPELAAEFGALYEKSFFRLIDPEAADPGAIAAFMQADGIHPNAEGVRVIVEKLG